MIITANNNVDIIASTSEITEAAIIKELLVFCILLHVPVSTRNMIYIIN